MASLQVTKIAGAVLLAGVVGTLSGFMAEILVRPHKLEKSVVVFGAAEAKATAAAAPTGPADILPLLAAADVAAGKAATKPCLACHTFDNGGAAKVGPNLYGIVGAHRAHMAGFAYSDGMKAKGGDWIDSDLNQFLYNPKGFINGTKMSFAGIKNDQERANVIAYLRSISPAAPAAR